MVTTNMMGVSISSAVLVPTCGTTHTDEETGICTPWPAVVGDQVSEERFAEITSGLWPCKEFSSANYWMIQSLGILFGLLRRRQRLESVKSRLLTQQSLSSVSSSIRVQRK